MHRNSPARLLLGSAIVVLGLSACDDLKKTIDPTGRSYKMAPDTSKKTTESVSNKNSSAPSKPAPAAASAPAASRDWRAAPTQREVPPLTTESAIAQGSEMLLASPRGWIEMHRGRASSGGRNLTLFDPMESPWGLAIGDLNQDGAEDAVFAVRAASRTDTSWILAVLVDHAGKLECIQAIPLAGVAGVAGLEATQGGVLLATSTGDTRLFGWVGGELVGN